MADQISGSPDELDAEQRYVQQLVALAEVGRAVTSSLDLSTLLRALVDLLRESMGYYGVNVWLLTEPPETVQLKGGLTPQGIDLSQREIQIPTSEENNVTRVCKAGVHFLSNSLDKEHPRPLGDLFPEAQAQLILPLKIAQKHVGALELLHTHQNAFHERDVMLLRSLADQTTIALRNATLYQEEQSRRHLAETLYQIGHALSSTIKLDEVLELILKELDSLVPSDRSGVLLREGDELQFVAARGFPDDTRLENLRVQLHADSIFSEIFGTQKPMSIPDVLRHPDWQQMGWLPQTRSWMGVPLNRSDQVIGMVSLTRQNLKPFTYSEVTLAQTFASQAAIALENARLYDRLARFNLRLEEMVQERTEELRLAYGRLELLDHTKSDFIKVTSHELRTPLTVLLGYSQMLLQHSTISADAMLAQLVAGIYSGAERLHDIVNSMLDIAKIDSNALEILPERVSIGLLIRNVAGNYKNALRQRGLNLNVTDTINDLPPIEADSDALQKVFYQLLSNAVKYTPDGGSITISGSWHSPNGEIADEAIEIVIGDSGIGIAPEHQELIFAKFYQTGEVALHSSSRTKFKGGGAGLGLPIARGIVNAHGGKMWAESPGYDEIACPGSRFHIILPLHSRKALP